VKSSCGLMQRAIERKSPGTPALCALFKSPVKYVA
jgi:hypothetical protein